MPLGKVGSDMSQPPEASVAPPLRGSQYNNKIILASVALLCLVVLFIIALHVYAKWFWRRSARRQQALWRRRNAAVAALRPQDQELSSMTGGLDKAIIDALPTFIYKVSQILPHETGMECAVCLSDFQEGDKGRRLPKCSHSFHSDCIDVWFLSHTTCPLCRASADLCEARPQPGAADSEEFASNQASDADDASVNEDAYAQPQPSTADVTGGPLPSPGWGWRRSISDRFVQSAAHAGVQFPTNVLFWGNDSHVNSRASAPQAPPTEVEQRQWGARSLPHSIIDMPWRCGSSSEAGDGDAGQNKAAGAGLNVFKRLLSRERRVFPMEHELGVVVGGHDAGTSSAPTALGSLQGL
ncbi:hypothetical protein KP509_06G045100 [Ceratopteris richardii]|uniref:RING-type E3 ubiquitin transferase n=1 Tax=Ceratopteris richardii TaxID=49495 RepID=A0A8T2UNA9_CERRI|nr:hypothetical protein KP509_06G045100 [Ceratopteris richardii]